MLLDEKLVVMDVDLEDAQQCIEYMGKLFEEHGYVKSGYAQAVMQREEEYPTGLPGKGINIAIPHTNNALVIKPGIGVLIPKKPVVFSMMGMKTEKLECEVIIPLVIKDSKKQINLLKKMMGVIQNGELLKKIRDSKDKKEIIELLSVLEEDNSEK